MPGTIQLVFSSSDQLNFKKHDGQEFYFVLEGQIVKYVINQFGKTCIKNSLSLASLGKS